MGFNSAFKGLNVSNLFMKRTELLAGLSIRSNEKLQFYVSYYLQGNAPVKCILYASDSLRLS
jgi:hypothetical protein